MLNGYIWAEQGQISTAAAFERAAPATLVGAALFFSCLGGTMATLISEREQRTLKRLFISPLSGISYFFGIFLAYGGIGLGQTLLVYAIATLLGAQFSGSVLLVILIILLSMLGYVGLGFILGTQFARRPEDMNALVAAFGVPLLILGGAFLPTSILPDSLLNFAVWNPIYHMNEALTQASTPGIEAASRTHVWILVGFTGLMVVGGWLSYRRMIELERRL